VMTGLTATAAARGRAAATAARAEPGALPRCCPR